MIGSFHSTLYTQKYTQVNLLSDGFIFNSTFHCFIASFYHPAAARQPLSLSSSLIIKPHPLAAGIPALLSLSILSKHKIKVLVQAKAGNQIKHPPSPGLIISWNVFHLHIWYTIIAACKEFPSSRTTRLIPSTPRILIA